MMPQTIMMRAIQIRAPTRSRIRLLGISKMKYPRKKSAAPVRRRVELQMGLEDRVDEVDVHPVDVGDDVADEDERDEPADHLGQRPPFEFRRRGQRFRHGRTAYHDPAKWYKGSSPIVE